MVRRITSTLVFSFCVFAAVSWPINSVKAQTAFVLGGGYAQDCYIAVKAGASSRTARNVCDLALENEALSRNDLAATLVNRGILGVRDREAERALRDFNAALLQNPSLSAAFLNRAGAYLLMGRWNDAQIDADTALGIGLKEDEWAAHFNRGVALERLGRINDAYTAFQRAKTLAPNRPEIGVELARFTVVGANAGTPPR